MGQRMRISHKGIPRICDISRLLSKYLNSHSCQDIHSYNQCELLPSSFQRTSNLS